MGQFLLMILIAIVISRRDPTVEIKKSIRSKIKIRIKTGIILPANSGRTLRNTGGGQTVP